MAGNLSSEASILISMAVGMARIFTKISEPLIKPSTTTLGTIAETLEDVYVSTAGAGDKVVS